jgi:perosamine synthetase
VHILGHPVDLTPLLEAARKYGLAVVEDATESLGAKHGDTSVGHLGDVACFSFNGNKLLTTGGGGMLVTDNEAWARRARYLTTQAKDDPIEYVHQEIGFNYRLTNVQAAMGVAQVERLAEFVERKRLIAARYGEALAGIDGVSPMAEAPWATSAWWMYTVLIDEARFGRDSRSLLKALEGSSIQTRPLWQPLHCSRAHLGAYHEACPVAERLNREALSLPCSVGLTEDDQRRVTNTIAALEGAAAA